MKEVPAIHVHESDYDRTTVVLIDDQLCSQYGLPLERKSQHDGPIRNWGYQYDGDCIAYGPQGLDTWHVMINKDVLAKKAIDETTNT